MPETVRVITQKHLMSVNCILVTSGSGFVLVDTGLAARRASLLAELEAAGCKPGGLRLVVVTHGHLDHNGSTAYLQKRYRAPVAMHEGDAEMAERGDMFTGMKGLSASVLRGVAPLLGFSYEPFKPDILLRDGQSLREFGLDAEVLHLPGHSRGSVSILTAEGSLICGDLLENTEKPRLNTLIQDRGDYDRSIRRLRGLAVKTVYPGHGPPFQMESLEAP